MKVEDRHISESLRLAKLPSGKAFVLAVYLQKNKRDKGILAHALTLAKLECAVEALERVGAVRMPGKFMAAEACQRIALEAITQIRSESHE